MKTNKFYIMVGNIGGGKSTYIKDNITPATIISKDGIRYALGGGEYVFDPKLEPIVHSTTMHLTRKLCEAGVSRLVLDETNVQKKGRKQFIKIAQERDYEVIAVVLPDFDMDVAVDRRLTNPHCQPDRELWESVWTKFYEKFQYPTLEEGFDNIVQIQAEEVI